MLNFVQFLSLCSFSVFLFFDNRALKPSNVYIQNNGSHVVVGDFCLPSILSDLKTHNRPSIGQWFKLNGFTLICSYMLCSFVIDSSR